PSDDRASPNHSDCGVASPSECCAALPHDSCCGEGSNARASEDASEACSSSDDPPSPSRQRCTRLCTSVITPVAAAPAISPARIPLPKSASSLCCMAEALVQPTCR